jgi:hypothetical protein
LRIIGLAIIRCTNKARTSTIANAHHHRDARPNVDYGCGRGVAPTLGGSTGSERSIEAAFPNIQAGWSCCATALGFWREVIGQRRCFDGVANLRRLKTM